MKLLKKLTIGAVVGMVVGLLFWFGAGESIEELAIDQGLRMCPKREADNSIQLVVVDDTDIKQFEQWPIPRGAHVNVVQILHALKVANTSFDIVFGERSKYPEHDAAFHEMVESAGNVTLAYYFREIGNTPGPDDEAHFVEGNRYGVDPDAGGFMYGVAPEPLYDDFSTPLAAVNAEQTSKDKIVRRIPLFLSHGGKLYPTIAMQSVIQAFDLEPDQIRIEPGSHESLIGTPRGQIRIPVDDKCQMRVRFDSTESLMRRSHSYTDLFQIASDETLAKEAMPLFDGVIAFVGNASTGNTDVVLTRGGPMPGVVVQAAVAENILSGSFLRSLPKLLALLCVVIISSMAAVFVHGAHPWRSIVLTVLLMAAWSVVAFLALKQSYILPYLPVLAATTATALVLYSIQSGRVINSFGGYVPKALRRILLSNMAWEERPARRELTIFFSDIRGFTNWAEKTDPDEVVEVLNEYLSTMSAIVEKHGGTLDKFIGDCVMAFFGAPVEREDHATAALCMAWEMQEAVSKLNAKWKSKGRQQIHVGIGLNSGFVTYGNFGSMHFKDYTVIGREVNLAARIESCTPGGMILISERTNAMVQKVATTRLFAEFLFKGIAEPVAVYEALTIEGMQKSLIEPEVAEWHCETCRNTGPYTLSGLKAMIGADRIKPDALVRRTDGSESIVLSSLFDVSRTGT